MSGLVVDTSALVAMMLEEPSAPWLRDQLQRADERHLSAASLVEFGIVLESRSTAPPGFAQRAVLDAAIAIAAVDEQAADRALVAWRRFGKGRHPAALNFGDCFTYALAEQRHEPVLCVGDDFVRTDLAVLRP